VETATFYRSVSRAFASAGKLRLSSITLDGDLVAFELWLAHKERIWLIKTAYNERYRRLSPGLVLRLWTVERAFELQLDAIELMGSADPHKLYFATAEREYRTLRSYRRGVVPLLQYAYRRWGRPALSTHYHRARDR
jgi:CelD/BcsL family acetyltransferase involved in cellulose biosynthesis